MGRQQTGPREFFRKALCEEGSELASSDNNAARQMPGKQTANCLETAQQAQLSETRRQHHHSVLWLGLEALASGKPTLQALALGGVWSHWVHTGLQHLWLLSQEETYQTLDLQDQATQTS